MTANLDQLIEDIKKTQTHYEMEEQPQIKIAFKNKIKNSSLFSGGTDDKADAAKDESQVS
jgi:hypothetical protein